MILGGRVGVKTLVMIVTFDIKMASLYVLGIAGAAMVSERMSEYRPVAASLFGGAMINLGLVLLKLTSCREHTSFTTMQPWTSTDPCAPHQKFLR